jgi:type II secretory pathway pseudopilin PulG
MKKAFTLIELLVFIGIFTTIIVSFITIFVALVNVQSDQSAVSEVNQESQFLLQQIQYYVESARLVDMVPDVATSTLVLREYGGFQDPTSITVIGGVVYLQQGVGGVLQPLTPPNKVLVPNLSFTRHYNVGTNSAAYGTDSVSFSFTMAATSTNNQAYSQTFQSSATVLAPVGKIAMIQQTNAANNNLSISPLTATYPSNNEKGDLLVAVVADTMSSAGISVSDSAGNVWNLIASNSYPAYNQQTMIFDAVNSINSSNTVTAAFGSSYAYATLNIYEYRGASTSSSFDASSTQLQPDTQTPSSGFANATSSVELLFGVTYNGNTVEIPAAGIGFILESSSTVSDIFTEDAVQYVTTPVAAPWQYSATTPSSSALIVTFK